VQDWRQHLDSNPQVCNGQLCESVAEGSNRDEILRSYPSLRDEHIDAALAYAAELAREESLLPLSPP
jgi:uncharacterized protein (DUF433 family)